MSRSAASPASAGRPRKSPLRLATGGEPSFPARREARLSPGQLRAMMISEFEQWLRSRTNQEKRPFHEETIVAYAKAGRALSAWMTASKIEGDFTACDTAVLNRFFRDYHAAHTRGGTNTAARCSKTSGTTRSSGCSRRGCGAPRSPRCGWRTCRWTR